MSSDGVTLEWTKSRSDGGSPLTGYVIERRDTTSNYWTRVGSVDQRRTSFVVTNLRPGAEYQLQVLAENDIGVSDPCTLTSPVKIPAAPAAGVLTILTAFSSVRFMIDSHTFFTVSVIILLHSSCKYPSSGRNKLSRFALEFSRPLRASVRSFISIHQVAPNDLDLDLD